MNKNQWYENQVARHIKAYQEWSDMADEIDQAEAKERRRAYAKEALADAARVVDKADRDGITLAASVSLEVLPLTRTKLKEELAAKAALLDAREVEIGDLKAELKRAHTACIELDAEVEQTAERLQRVAFALCCGTFMVGAALGLIVASV
jgi:hypothetical protein